jgi:ATP-dependent Lon protease
MNYLATLFPHMSDKTVETSLLLPLRNIVLLPGITLPVVAGRPHSIAVAEATALTPQKQLVIAAIRPEAAQRLEADSKAEIEKLEEIYPIATLATIQRTIRLPMGPIQLVVEGLERVRIEQVHITDRVYEVKFQRLPQLTASGTSATIDAMTGALRTLWGEVASMNPNFPDELLAVLLHNDSPADLAYQTCMLLQQGVTQTQAVLEKDDLEQLLRQVLADLQQEVKVQRLRGEILGETKKEIDQQQREFFLRQQLHKIQQELGEVESETKEI